jgi:hypothetical protein
MDTLVLEAPIAPAAKPPQRPRVNIDQIHEKVSLFLEKIPSTTTLDFGVRLSDLGLTNDEQAYYSRALRNVMADERRANRVWYRRFTSLDALMEKADQTEEPVEKPEFIPPSTHADNPCVILEKAETAAAFRQALLELPIQLAVMVYALPMVNGNVSKLARQLGQPQRRTARQVERIQRHLAAKGLRA